MMPTPEQEARLKLCKSSAEYDAEWERITNENLKTMTERAAAEIRALREQEHDFWITNIGFENQRRGLESSNNQSSHGTEWMNRYDDVVGEKYLNTYLDKMHKDKQALPPIDPQQILNPSGEFHVENKKIVLLGSLGVLFGIVSLMILALSK